MNPQQQKNLLIILIPSTILIILWIGFGIYNKSVKSTISQSQTAAVQPIAGTFDMSVFELLRKRQTVLPSTQADQVVEETSEEQEASESGETQLNQADNIDSEPILQREETQ